MISCTELLIKRSFLLMVMTMAVCMPGRFTAYSDDDPVLSAIQAEVERTLRNIRLPDSPEPYFLSCELTCYEHVYASAMFGALTGSYEGKHANLRVVIRVGDYQLDNSNFLPKQMWGGWSRLDSPLAVPIDDDLEIVKRAIWWSMDRAYKQAVENLKRKRAVLKNRSTLPVADDFAKAPVFTYSSEVAPQTMPAIEAIEKHALQLSKLLVANRTLQTSATQVNVNTEERWYVNSEGTKVHLVENNASVVVSAVAQADDGVMVGDMSRFAARSYNRLPPFDEQKAAVLELGKRVEAMRVAPLLDDFVGPVLFEGQAAAELCARILPEAFSNRREPITENEQMSHWFGRSRKESLRRKIGRRVMATDFNVIDDPTLETFDGTELMGCLTVDVEGVKPRKVHLVKDGILKTLLASRTPDKKVPASNGHAVSYGSGMFDEVSAQAGITSLMITYKDGLEQSALRERLIQTVKDQDVEFGLLVQRIPPPGLYLDGQHGGMRSFGGDDDESLIEDPLCVYAVYPDGHEKLVRVVAFKGVGLAAFKDVLAAGKAIYVYNRQSGGRTSSIVSPSILFEEGIVLKPETGISKPPFLQSPLLYDD